jgi:AcrR family transcriptional regulator
VPEATEPRAARRVRRQRGSISPADIVRGAFEVAAGSSLDRLSMPSLAEHLDVGVTSIYWYFRKKDDLLAAMTDVAVERYAAEMRPLEGLSWPDALRRYFKSERKTFAMYPTLLDLLLVRTQNYSRAATRQAFQLVESVLTVLVAQGFSAENALHVYQAA